MEFFNGSCSACDCTGHDGHKDHPEICKCGHQKMCHHGVNPIYVDLDTVHVVLKEAKGE